MCRAGAGSADGLKKKHSITKETPFYLVYGKDPLIPADTNEPPYVYDENNQDDLNEYRAKQLEKLWDRRSAAQVRFKLDLVHGDRLQSFT
ncbi:unnamed protein product [Didymodactylos carnosus]|uniref:Uncharacterized protein n=1 Tax=Didymodactylos carnosus TaxID=1234261 RepID=A0A814ZV03_9BILA|nr:unnamed protein product [Didymodactylos carnosus]CAF4012691.1 unnamed protein product [Didymodactylos carnosus]